MIMTDFRKSRIIYEVPKISSFALKCNTFALNYFKKSFVFYLGTMNAKFGPDKGRAPSTEMKKILQLGGTFRHSGK